ncbi:MAG: hypothetical protein JNL21_29570 [Myxococcales bacterium]|nr:hypothetical protein [Myxococcales bacterium]
MIKRAFVALLLTALGLLGCSEDQKFEASNQTDTSGPVAKSGAAWEVWSVDNAWSDTDTAAAKKAGLAWGENSGLTWEEKFDRWVGGLETMPSESGWGQTISITTPFGDKKLPAPTLECAEVAIFLRVAFASWYHLPFYLRGWDSETKQAVFAGHFGFVNAAGNGVGKFPRFKEKYKDHEKTWKPGDAWPSDTVLRGRRLGDDDTVAFLTGPNGEEVGAGAYFDEIFLNKRTGHFMRLILLYFGSVNLADGSNMFHVAPEAASAGDVLLERWQKKGIGHTIPLLRVTSPLEGKLAIEAISGSMPRRQPRYDEPMQARSYFTLDATGGEGVAGDGTPYAKLGGGLRRWRTATKVGGKWVNKVSKADESVAIANSDVDAIAARPARFDEILLSGSPEEQEAALVAAIQNARHHLSEHPASCSARENRENAFRSLGALASQLGTTKDELEKKHRTLDDYVFGALVYEDSKTCCWNSTTPAMAEIVLDYARAEKEAADEEGMCVEPTVFRSRADGYELWRAHAQKLGREADWLAWSEDEPCAQRDVAEDTIASFDGKSYCSISAGAP